MVSTVTTLVPILIALLKRTQSVIHEINQRCQSKNLPPAFEVSGLQIRGNSNYRFEGFGINLVPLALTFWVHYKPGSADHVSLDKISIPITWSDFTTIAPQANTNTLMVPLDSLQFRTDGVPGNSPSMEMSYLEDDQVCLQRGAIDEVGAARYDTAANTLGHYVAALQKDLTILGFAPGLIDGDFGANTESALRAFQQAACSPKRRQAGRVVSVAVSYQGSVSGVCDRATCDEIQRWLTQNYQVCSYLCSPIPGTTYRNNGGYRGDTGLDINVPCGTQCVAAADGEVVYAEEGHTSWTEDADPDGSGYQTPRSILIKLDQPISYKGTTYYFIWYTHLSDLEPAIRKRDGESRRVRVQAGQSVGKTGVANNSPHLHLGVLGDRAQTICMPYRDIAELIWSTATPDVVEPPRPQPSSPRKTIKHRGPGGSWERTITLPCTGCFVEESHYSTTQESFPEGRKFPKTKDENILPHLQRSYPLYRVYDPEMSFEALYRNSWHKVWTPPEGWEYGQGSVGEIRPTPEEELWFMTMMWAPGEKPPVGTKFLLRANNRQIVVVAGYETGPGDKQYLGGITREVHAWLRTNNESLIEIQLLVDQSVKIGPITSSSNSVRPYRVTANSLYVRSEPSINAEIVGTLQQYQLVPAGTQQVEGQRVWMQIHLPDLTGWASMKFLELGSSPELEEPRWLAIARQEMAAGVREVPGAGDHPRIREYLESTTLDRAAAAEDETPWCSAFVNWCMEQAHEQGTNSAWARSWLNWGQPLSAPKPGCVAVFSRGTQSGHVAFYLRETSTHIKVLGGNQSDAVTITEIERSRLLGYRWPVR